MADESYKRYYLKYFNFPTKIRINVLLQFFKKFFKSFCKPTIFTENPCPVVRHCYMTWT